MKRHSRYSKEQVLTTHHTLSLDTKNRTSTVIRKSNLANVTQTIPTQAEMNKINKPRLIHMVAFKAVNEYHSNQRKLRRFYFEDQAARAALTQPSRPNPVNREPLGHARVLKIAEANKKNRQKTSETKAQSKRKRQKGRQQQNNHVRTKAKGSSPQTKSTIQIGEKKTPLLQLVSEQVNLLKQHRAQYKRHKQSEHSTSVKLSRNQPSK